MKRTACTAPLLFLLPLFFVFQIFLVPHLHIDEHGEAHAHSHVVVDEAQVSFHENIDVENSVGELPTAKHRHSHDELHKSSGEVWLHKLSPRLTLLDGKFLPSPCTKFAPWFSTLAPPFHSIAETAYLNHVFRNGHVHALLGHIRRMLTVRLTT